MTTEPCRKRPYASHALAAAEAARLTALDTTLPAWPVEPYWCPRHHAYHVGHIPWGMIITRFSAEECAALKARTDLYDAIPDSTRCDAIDADGTVCPKKGRYVKAIGAHLCGVHRAHWMQRGITVRPKEQTS